MDWTLKEVKNLVKDYVKDKSLNIDGIHLIKFGQNAMFYLPKNSLVLRVHRPETSEKEVFNEVDVCNFLIKNNFSCNEPVKIQGKEYSLFQNIFISTWKYYNNDSKSEINYKLFGKKLKEMHSSLKKYNMKNKVVFDPFYSILSRLNKIDSDEKKVQYYQISLLDIAYRLQNEFSKIENEEFIIHGDMHPGNIILTNEAMVFVDFENISYGNKNWDLITLAVANERFGLSDENYEEFIKGYGFDVKKDENFNFFKKTRELFIVSWLSQFIYNEEKKEEFLKRANHILNNKRSGDYELWSAR